MFFAVPAPDLALLALLNQKLHNSVLDVLMPLISSALVMWGLAVIALVPLALRHTRRTLACFLVILAVAGVSDFSTKLLKESFGRIRPLNSVVDTRYVEDGAWRTLTPDKVQADKHGSSYPSAHASTSMAAAVLAMLFWPGSRPWLLLLPLAIGWSRVYLGKHFPTDVLAGWFFGLALAGFSWQILKWTEGRLGRPGFLTEPPEPRA